MKDHFRTLLLLAVGGSAGKINAYGNDLSLFAQIASWLFAMLMVAALVILGHLVVRAIRRG